MHLGLGVLSRTTLYMTSPFGWTTSCLNLFAMCVASPSCAAKWRVKLVMLFVIFWALALVHCLFAPRFARMSTNRLALQSIIVSRFPSGSLLSPTAFIERCAGIQLRIPSPSSWLISPSSESSMLLQSLARGQADDVAD